MLRIADKEDAKKIEDFFNSRVENNTDPNEYVKPRSNDKVVIASNLGRIAIIEDHNHEIVTVCFGYTHRVDDMPEHETPRMISEMGTVLSSVKGLGLPSIAISALSLSVHNKEGEDHPLMAKISTGNSAANGLFGKSLKWEIIEDKEDVRAIFNSSVGDTIRESYGLDSSAGDATKACNWYLFGEAAADNARELLQELFEVGYITKNNKKIIFEFDKDDFNFELSEGNNELTQELHEIFDNEDGGGDLENHFTEHVFMDRDTTLHELENNQP